jgi:hypothetical protein
MALTFAQHSCSSKHFQLPYTSAVQSLAVSFQQKPKAEAPGASQAVLLRLIPVLPSAPVLAQDPLPSIMLAQDTYIPRLSADPNSSAYEAVLQFGINFGSSENAHMAHHVSHDSRPARPAPADRARTPGSQAKLPQGSILRLQERGTS